MYQVLDKSAGEMWGVLNKRYWLYDPSPKGEKTPVKTNEVNKFTKVVTESYNERVELIKRITQEDWFIPTMTNAY
jgi:hypothetical protein